MDDPLFRCVERVFASTEARVVAAYKVLRTVNRPVSLSTENLT